MHVSKIARPVMIFCFVFAIATTSIAADRGLKVTIQTIEGEDVDLYQESHALVIGNGTYNKGWDPIPGATRDAADVAEALRYNGFNVVLKTNISKDDFEAVFRQFCVDYGQITDSRILFYFAGHGFTQKMQTEEDLGYLIMVDTPLPEKDPSGFSIKSVDMISLVTQAKLMKSRHVLFMFDSCFSGAILNLRDSVSPKGITESLKYPVRQFITAGRENETVPDNSKFKTAFLDLIEGRDEEPHPDGYITGEELGYYLKYKVPEYSPMQHPQYGKIRDPNLDKGDFVFVVKKRTLITPEPLYQPEPIEEPKLQVMEDDHSSQILKLEKKRTFHKWVRGIGIGITVLAVASFIEEVNDPPPEEEDRAWYDDPALPVCGGLALGGVALTINSHYRVKKYDTQIGLLVGNIKKPLPFPLTDEKRKGFSETPTFGLALRVKW